MIGKERILCRRMFFTKEFDVVKMKLLALVLAIFCVGRAAADDNALDLENAISALDEVNAARAARGLKPFIYDEGLARAAAGCAEWRAARLCEGHTPNDFAAVPRGYSARVAGCAAWPAHMGWGSCDTFANHTYCGAAWVMGRDNRRYMHAFYRD